MRPVPRTSTSPSGLGKSKAPGAQGSYTKRSGSPPGGASRAQRVGRQVPEGQHDAVGAKAAGAPARATSNPPSGARPDVRHLVAHVVELRPGAGRPRARRSRPPGGSGRTSTRGAKRGRGCACGSRRRSQATKWSGSSGAGREPRRGHVHHVDRERGRVRGAAAERAARLHERDLERPLGAAQQLGGEQGARGSPAQDGDAFSAHGHLPRGPAGPRPARRRPTRRPRRCGPAAASRRAARPPSGGAPRTALAWSRPGPVRVSPSSSSSLTTAPAGFTWRSVAQKPPPASSRASSSSCGRAKPCAGRAARRPRARGSPRDSGPRWARPASTRPWNTFTLPRKPITNGVAGWSKTSCGRADLLDPAVVHHHHAVGDLERLLLVVGHEDAGDADLVVQAAQPAAQLLAHLGVERAEGLVEQQHLAARRRARARGPRAGAGRPRAATGSGRPASRAARASAGP